MADYPFTTLEPVLGTLDSDERQLVLADIPGLIEGASDGAGLGHDFLAHVERTRLLVHVLDLAPLDGSDPVANWQTIEHELAAHDPRLAALPRLLALSKADLVTPEAAAQAAAAAWRERLGDGVPVLVTSSATRRRARRARPRAAAPRPRRGAAAGRRARRRGGARRAPRLPSGRRPRLARGARWGTGAFRVSGVPVERLMARFDSTTRRRWPTSSTACTAWASCARSRPPASSPATTSRSAASCSSWTPDSLRRPMARYVVKLGSSIVAEDSGALRPDVLARVCDQVAARHAAGDDVVVVTSGAIARGIQLMGLSPRPTAIEDLQAASAVGQGKLYRVYDELLRERGVTSAQVLLTFFDMSARTHYLNARQTLRRLLDWSVVPVINENDTTTTDEISFGDNDFLAAQVAILIGADLLVLLTDIDGLFTADPRTDAAAALVEEVDDFASLGAMDIGHTTSPLGSGGMRSKVVAAEMATAAGIPAVICSGLDDGALGTVLDGGAAGTRFPAQQARYSSFKLWLRYAKPSHGTVVIDAGAARALREGGTSLLPVGIVDVRGGFDAGDAVHVAEGAAVIGKGITNYSATELRQVMGLKSAQVREVLPRATDEAVHRDYFVLV